MLRFSSSSSASAGTKRKAYRTKEDYSILSDKCSNCDKTKKEIEKRLKGGSRLSHEEIRGLGKLAYP